MADVEEYSNSDLERYVDQVQERLAGIHARIKRAGGDPDQLRIVGVTKTFGVEAVIAAFRAGITDIGENYADELVKKATSLAVVAPDVSPRWHFLGEIQRNKINRLSRHVSLYEGLDRYEEGVAIARRSPGASVLVEVNTANLAQRGGVVLDEVPDLVEHLQGLDIVVAGLMTVAPQGGGEIAMQAFRSVATLKCQLGLRELSMGMSDDLEYAVAEGSTMIRIGRALFGSRQ